MTNFFQLFELPLSFDLDQGFLTKKYYALNKEYHPDKFSLSDSEEQSHALAMTAQINKAYKVLRKKQSRIRHILELLHAAPEEGSETMPQEFLMEMMEINEAIMEYKFDPTTEAAEKIEKDISVFEDQLEQQLQGLASTLDFETPEETQLSSLKSYYLKSKYLRRLKDNLQNNEAEV